MKILHTGDWHAGKALRGRSRAAEHVAALEEIAEVARREAVDLVLVAGDLFDSSAPSPEAERIVYRALLDLSTAGAKVVVISGNHDNPRRLDAIAPLFEPGNVIVRPDAVSADDGGVLDFVVGSGERVVLALLPWVSKRYVVSADHLMATDADDHAATYKARVASIVAALTAPFGTDSVNLLCGHLAVEGAAPGGGERAAQTIFEYQVSATIFPGNAHYVALGHFHRPQKIAAPCPVHYCGSPLQLDFSDTDAAKSALIIEAAPGTPATVRTVELTAGRRLRTVEGTLEQLAELVNRDDDFLRVRVREPARAGLADEVRELLPNAIDVTIAPDLQGARAAMAGIDRASGAPHDLFAEYLTERNAADKDVLALFDELYEDMHETAAP